MNSTFTKCSRGHSSFSDNVIDIWYGGTLGLNPKPPGLHWATLPTKLHMHLCIKPNFTYCRLKLGSFLACMHPLLLTYIHPHAFSILACMHPHAFSISN